MMNKRRGFTLIEFVIYIGILALIATSLTYFSLNVSLTTDKNHRLADTQWHRRFLLDLLSQKIRQAAAVTAPAAGASGSTLALDMPAPAADLEFSLTAAGVMVVRAGGGPPINLSAPAVKITNLNFTNLAAAGERDHIQVSFILANDQPAETSVSRRP